MGEVMRAEQRDAAKRGATLLAPVREHEETDDAPRPPAL